MLAKLPTTTSPRLMFGFSFKGNPEFKLFIQQLGEVNSLEDLDQNPAILTFRAARYCIVYKTLSPSSEVGFNN